ncbi:aminotransferase class I/II-fold pyridoxal phosphate-dependent enzyme [Salsuginibacillus kocurii]|uniref:aminotransferase class I/II-fold pyridoxal phosphate-dependent enzyme n=1 Tax=Salsuginibacillus kocurii TaxID=427078 RepID=UPI000377A7CA|nr:aminotransferase class I/II-fold pyridoxal phosphate-dependent enzyme [Salsuginibacillus kocurii]
MNDQKQMPLYEALEKHNSLDAVSMHVPGHKHGQLFSTLSSTAFQQIGAYDQTEITGLDDLYAPSTVIMEAESLAASYYRSFATLFLVGGSTVGNLAAILASFQEGDKVLVQRDVHKSVLNGLELARVHPVFLAPVIEKETGLSLGVKAEEVEKACKETPGLDGIIVTSPSYYGVSKEIKEIVQAAKKYGLKIIVDEAHGAHFTSSNAYPPSALEAGADIVVHSAHKTLPALTMGAWLHVSEHSQVTVEECRNALAMVQSSSPSYLIMASLDIARAYLASLENEDGWQLKKMMERRQEAIAKKTGIQFIRPATGEMDPLKWVIRSPKGLNGWQFQAALEKERVYPELGDFSYVLFIWSLHSSSEETERVIEAIERVVKREEGRQAEVEPLESIIYPSVSELALTYQELGKAAKVTVEANEAVGEIAAAPVTPYPPGIPLIQKGERITATSLKLLKEWKRRGGHVQGFERDCVLIVSASC